MEKVEIKDEPAGEDCEKCGHPMVFKMGRYGKFMACSQISQIVVIRNQLLKKSVLNVRSVKKGKLLNDKSKKKRLFYGCDTISRM